ncbi:MAG: dihydrodipicolinate reductase [Acidimicrobiales bacterium]
MINGGSMALRVVQWATGPVGREALRAIIEHPELDLTGVVVYSPDKDGLDAGELCGLPQTGIRATRDPALALATGADAVCYTPGIPDLAEVCRLLAGGANVVATPFLFYPPAYGSVVVDPLVEACRRGGTSVHGTGINPGFVADLLVLTCSGLVRSLHHVEVHEVGNWSLLESRAMVFENARFGSPPGAATLAANPYARTMSDYFKESIHMAAAGLGVTLERCTESQELLVTDKPIDVLSGTVEAGTVSGQHFRWAGVAAGRDLLSIDTWWWVGGERPESYPSRRPDGWSIDIEGSPSIRLSMLALGSLDPASSLPIKAHVEAASLATAMHAVNAIPAVCAAEPGIRTVLDLPLITGRRIQISQNSWIDSEKGDQQ